MSRTEEQFAKAYKDAKWFVEFHRKSVWLVPSEHGYSISVVQPIRVPEGTTAVKYDPQMNIVSKYPMES